MKRTGMLVALAAAMAGAAVAGESTPAAARNAERIQKLLKEMGKADLAALPALSIERLKLPPASVDVMRARVEETYSIDGIGTDTVELTGWIAVVHDNARPAEGESEITWGKAVMDTEFVGMDLRGTSKVFGPIQVTLDTSQNNRGQVGAISLPADAEKALEQLKAPGHLLVDGAPEAATGGATDQAPAPMELKEKKKPQLCNPACNCTASLSVSVGMKQLNLVMTTARPVHMYSSVETIPPVGYTASISLTPTGLVSAGRQVGTLTHAEVKFREIVKRVVLEGTTPIARR